MGPIMGIFAKQDITLFISRNTEKRWQTVLPRRTMARKSYLSLSVVTHPSSLPRQTRVIISTVKY